MKIDNIIFYLSSFLHKIFSKISEEYYKYIPVKTIIKLVTFINWFWRISCKHFFSTDEKRKTNDTYDREDLLKQLSSGNLKLGLIPDGNRRHFRKITGKSNMFEKYKDSFLILKSLIKFSKFLGIKSITIYVLSVKNLNRSEEEVKALLKMLEEALDVFLASAQSNKSDNNNPQPLQRNEWTGFKIKAFGDLSLFSQNIRDKVAELERRPVQEKDFEVNLLIGYSGLRDLKNEKNNRSDTYRPCLLNLDCIIRTGNTHRLSDFMLCSFHEGTRLIFVDEMFPQMNYLYLFYLILKIVV
ncbi:Dehydrodolichyl diphosphate synthase [Cucumispora dikerogammari]|nr:Dehydrodolichyl diphosphate synthase [Cucumispora dikerogammari]